MAAWPFERGLNGVVAACRCVKADGTILIDVGKEKAWLDQSTVLTFTQLEPSKGFLRLSNLATRFQRTWGL